MTRFIRSAAAALFSALVLLLLLEGGFRVFGFPVGGSHFAEAIVLREGLDVRKPEGEKRIFTYGESTMHGCHYAPVSSPASWLQSYLNDYLPDDSLRVINFARLGKGSDFTLATFRETLAYQPDVAVFYLGHNDFSPRHRVDDIRREKAEWGERIKEAIKQSVFLSAVWRQVIRLKMIRDDMKVRDEVGYDTIEAPLHSGAGDAYRIRRTDPLFQENIRFFRQNILDIAELARKKGIPVVFFVPVSNLKDFSPNRSLNREDLSSEDAALWQAAYEKGRELQSRRLWSEAEAQYLKAFRLDDTHADLAFSMGRVLLAQGELERARDLFERARDYDALPLRAVSEIVDVFRELPVSENLRLIDTEAVIVSRVPAGIPGEPLVEDNVHFSVSGHALLARVLAREIAQAGWLAPVADWQWQRERPEEVVAESLGLDTSLLLSAHLKIAHYFGPRFENRLRFIRKALELSPDHPKALRSLAWTYWLMAQKEEAASVYGRLRKTHPDAYQEVLGSRPELSGLLNAA